MGPGSASPVVSMNTPSKCAPSSRAASTCIKASATSPRTVQHMQPTAVGADRSWEGVDGWTVLLRGWGRGLANAFQFVLHGAGTTILAESVYNSCR